MTRLHVVAMSDPDHDDLIAEGYVDDRCVMIVSQERGPGQFDVEFVRGDEDARTRLSVDDVSALLQRACVKLRQLKQATGEAQP
jgi:hypothetical protein